MISAVMPTYARVDLAFERGEGAWLIAADGRRFLDFTSGVAVTALGHAHPHLVAAIREQAGKVWHTSNLFRVSGQERLAQRLTERTFADTVFFTNSGTEAIECGIKVVRKHFAARGEVQRHRIITFEGAFHGRTLAALAATGNKKYLEGFEPPMPGFDQVPYGDLDAVRRAIGPETAAILAEPVQGEGGARTPPPGFLAGLRRLCDQHGLLLFLDEVQSGVGRTGKLFAHEWSGVAPDVMAIAKGIGGGFPVAGTIVSSDAGAGMTAGTHGSTYGGNPLAMAAANAVLDVVLADGFLEGVQQRASHLRQQLAMLADRHPGVIDEVRGQGLLALGGGDNVMRLLPPLIVSDAEIADGMRRLDAACGAVNGKGGPV